MKKITSKLKTKSFWVTLIGALTLVLSHCGIDISEVADIIISTVGGILLLFGLAISPAAPTEKDGADSDLLAVADPEKENPEKSEMDKKDM